jgi:pimeloyl-ACP methyl ester carboxylesterase
MFAPTSESPVKLKRVFKVASLALLSFGAITVTTGAVIEQVARARARREWKVPGKLVDVGGERRMQIDCRGSGSPTVVLESGLDNYGSLAWAAVHDSLARTTRTCAYSRAGIMWSDQASGRFDSRNAARDLHAALAASGESAPWVMVGHSIGAAYVMTFTQLFATEVSGVVFVDGSHPDQFPRYREATGKSLEPSATEARVGAALAWTGILRTLPSVPSPTTWPAGLGAASSAFLPTSLAALAEEARAIPATLAQAGQVRSFGERPLIVLTATASPTPSELAALGLSAEQGVRKQVAWRALHEDLATWSRRGRNEEVPQASHYIQFDRPDVVIAAVREVVGTARARVVRKP